MTNPTRTLVLLALALGLLAPATAAHAQKATEIYIPIGKSPGLSGKYTIIGHIRDIDRETRTLTIVGPLRTWTVRMDDLTCVWLDRSRIRRRNTVGTPADCRTSLMCEVKFQGRREPESVVCEWIKIRPAEAERPARRR